MTTTDASRYIPKDPVAYWEVRRQYLSEFDAFVELLTNKALLDELHQKQEKE